MFRDDARSVRTVPRWSRPGSIAIVAALLGLVAFASIGRERDVHEVRITLTAPIAAGAGADAVRAAGFDIDLSTRSGAGSAGTPAGTFRPPGSLPDWIEPTTRRGGPGAPEQVIVTMGRDASAAITADHVVLVRGDESVVLDIGGGGIVESPPDAPRWLDREGPHAPLVARFGRAGSIEVASRSIRVQRRGPS